MRRLKLFIATRPFFSPKRSNVTTSVFAAALLIGIHLLLINTRVIAQDEEGPDVVALFNAAQDLHGKGDLAGAIDLYEKAIKIEPAFPEAFYQRGMAEVALGKKVEAEKSFRRAIDLRADWTLPMSSLGSLLLDKGETAEAGRILSKVVEIEPQNPVALIALVDLRLKEKAPPEILMSLLSKITSLTGKANVTTSLWTARAALETALGKPALAKLSFAKTLATDPNSRFALIGLADMAIIEGDLLTAKDLLTRLDAAPASDPLKLLRANIFASEGKADEALAQLDSIQTPNASARELRAKINASRATSAIELEKLIDGDEKNPIILGRLCTLYRKDNPAKALDYCRKASNAEPGNVNHAVGFGAALVQARQFDSAVNVFRKILSIVPDNATAHANLATALFQLKRFAEAKIEFEWLTRTQPRSAGAYLFLGILHDESTEYLDAMANYQQYLKLADPVENRLDIDKVGLRLPVLQKLLKGGKGKK